MILKKIQQDKNLSQEGAKFFRCALQVNPSTYSSNFRGKDQKSDEESYNTKLIEKAVALNIKVIAVTDHNNVDAIKKLSEVAKKHEITVFPGFEVSSSEGVHVLCLFEPATLEKDVLARYLGGLGLYDAVPNSNISNKNLKEILNFTVENGGITIAAHITNDKGLLRMLRGQARIAAWKDKNLFSAQIPGSIQGLEMANKRIIENIDPEYKREHPVAIINASDVTKPEDLDDPAATSWIKMTEPSISGLKQAFLDPFSRIRLNSDPAIPDRTKLISISFDGGFLDSIKINLNENLNVLVGGRGTGKSTLIESLRYVIGLSPITNENKKNHEDVIKNVIKSGTKISLHVYTPIPAPSVFSIERTHPHPPVVKTEDGEISSRKPLDIISGIEIFGQHEIGELSKERDKLINLLNRFMPNKDDLHTRKEKIKDSLSQNRSNLLMKIKSRAQLLEKLNKYPEIKEKLNQYIAAGIEEKLKSKSQLVEEKNIINIANNRIDETRNASKDLKSVNLDNSFLLTEDIKELPGFSIIKELENPINELKIALKNAVKIIEDSLSISENKFNEIKERWSKERQCRIDTEYEKLLRKLQDVNVDGAEFIKLKEIAEQLSETEKRKEALDLEIQNLYKERNILLSNWNETIQSNFQLQQKAAKKINQNLNGRIKIELSFLGNRQELIDLLRNELSGRLSEIDKYITNNEISIPDFVKSCRKGIDELRKKISVPLEQARRIIDKGEELFLKIEEVEFKNTTSIQLNISTDPNSPEWRDTTRLSKGQKATAILLLLLLESNSPLIIDQPEDDLDNMFIAETIVQQLRNGKQKRQFIISTHNANLPVLGDAELIIGLKASGEAGDGKAHIPESHRGSIDVESIRHLIGEILEGGKTAFEMRRKKYGF